MKILHGVISVLVLAGLNLALSLVTYKWVAAEKKAAYCQGQLDLINGYNNTTQLYASENPRKLEKW